MKFILGKKLGMTTIHDLKNGALNVTLIECESNTISLVRDKKRDGYSAIQLETSKTSRKKTNREFRISEEDKIELKAGDAVTVESFVLGEEVVTTGRLQWSQGARINIEYEIHKESGQLAATGYTVQMFVDDQGVLRLAPPPLQEACRRRWLAGEFRDLR